MIAVACIALLLALVRYSVRVPDSEEIPNIHSLMAELCKYEATLMSRRADDCLARAKHNAPWDDPSEEAETLKCCPYPSDTPPYGSWSDQAAVWKARLAKRPRPLSAMRVWSTNLMVNRATPQRPRFDAGRRQNEAPVWPSNPRAEYEIGLSLIRSSFRSRIRTSNSTYVVLDVQEASVSFRTCGEGDRRRPRGHWTRSIDAGLCSA